jgi:hypothetical protein
MFKLSGSNHPNLLLVYEKARKIYDKNFISEKKKKRKRVFRFLRRFSMGVIVVCSLIFFYFSIHAINFYFIHKEAVTGKSNIEEALSLFSAQKTESAQYYSQLANDNFELSLSYLEEYKDNFWVKNNNFFYKEYLELIYLLSSGRALSNSVLKISEVQNRFNNIFNSEDYTKKELLNFIYESAPELVGIKANIDLSINSLANIKYYSLLRPFKKEINEIKQNLKFVSYQLDQQIALSQILPSFLGYPDNSKYLTIFQNNRRLTSTGGEIIAYGILENKFGEIDKFSSEAYENLQENIDFKDLSPDWPYTAKKILWQYKKLTEDNNDFDGVLLFNYDFFKELLTLTGPIIIDNNSYTKDNIDQLFKQSGKLEDLSKIILAAQKNIFEKKSVNFFEFFNFLSANFIKKNIIIYFTDKNFQEIAEDKGWSNNIKQTNSDYLMIIDSSVGDVKENDIKKKVDYTIDQGANGLFAKLNISYINTNSTDSLDKQYKNNVQVYVPQGSELLMFKGIDDGSLEVLEDKKNQKTIYTGYFSLEPGEIDNLKIYYKLPDSINKLSLSDEYNLFIQKQSGTKIDSLMVDLSFLNSIKLYNPTGFSADLIEKDQIIWETDLLIDRYFKIKF